MKGEIIFLYFGTIDFNSEVSNSLLSYLYNTLYNYNMNCVAKHNNKKMKWKPKPTVSLNWYYAWIN